MVRKKQSDMKVNDGGMVKNLGSNPSVRCLNHLHKLSYYSHKIRNVQTAFKFSFIL